MNIFNIKSDLMVIWKVTFSAFSIVFVFIGKDFNILIFLPSKLITEFVIDVINAVKDIRIKINIGILFIIRFFDIFKPSVSLVNNTKTLSNFKAMNIVAITNRTKAKPAFIINTGVLKNVSNSFFTNEIVIGLALMLSFFILVFLVVVTAVLLCVIGYYLIKLLKDLSVLTKNLNETSSASISVAFPTPTCRTLSIKDFPPKAPVDVIVADKTDAEHQLLLKPKMYTVGLGMKKDKDPSEVEEFFLETLAQNGLDVLVLIIIGLTLLQSLTIWMKRKMRD